jgi:arginyl-tRNA synthetase
VLASSGYEVVKEYYINDAGSQMDAFYRSLDARYQQALGRDAPMPAEGYFGDYMVDIANEIIAEEGERFLDQPAELGRIGMKKVIAAISSDLELLGVTFDEWFSEQSLFEQGQYDKAMSLLSEKGYTVEKEGAVWFSSTALGEDKDNVLVRSDGSPTYFASDLAYHYNKFIERGFERVIDIWGADHQGHVSRMKAVIGALGIDRERLQVIISQMVTLKRGDAIIRASKRTGEMITLRELVDEVGVDACRFFFLSRSADSQMDFDLELAKRQSADNPVYYVQYAHARICSILRLAEEKGIDYSGGDVSLLTSDPELALIRKMLQLPEVMELVSQTLEPHHLPYYATETATIFHNFYEKCRVISDDQALTGARLKLVAAAGIVLARTLHLMGMSAPESM